MDAASPAVEVVGLSHRYGQRLAIDDLTLAIRPGEIFAFLGPNGGGKTTLFRVLSTLIPVQSGAVRLFGLDVTSQTVAARRRIGVVFQAASLDRELSVVENLGLQAALYGLRGGLWQQRQAELLDQFGLADLRHERTGKLSGGQRRRVELAKGLLHRPPLLLLDEPSTGLDPGARIDLWQYLRRLRDEHGATIVLTTHLLDEADRADRITILDRGRLVAWDTPDALRATVGGDSITITAREPQILAAAIRERFGVAASVVDDRVRLEQAAGHRWVAQLMDAFPDQIEAIRLGKASLEDVFIDRTGHRFASSEMTGPGV